MEFFTNAIFWASTAVSIGGLVWLTVRDESIAFQHPVIVTMNLANAQRQNTGS